jgi:hypothetical protein
MENVCIAAHEDYGLYAVGSKSHTSLMDARTIQCVKKILSKVKGAYPDYIADNPDSIILFFVFITVFWLRDS